MTEGSDKNQTTRFSHLESRQKTNRLRNAGMLEKCLCEQNLRSLFVGAEFTRLIILMEKRAIKDNQK